MPINLPIISASGAKSTVAVNDPVIDAPSLPPILGTAFHVSPTGNDSNPGTLAAPWRTFTRAMQQNYRTIDALLFQCGGTYYGQIDKQPTISGSGNRFLVAYYGSGPKPIITAYMILDIASAWAPHSTGVWKIVLSNPANRNGFKGTIASNGQPVSNVGHLLVGDTVHGVRKPNITTLTNQWDFFCDTTTLYVKSTVNPAALGKIFAAPDGHAIFGHSHMEINGLELTGHGGHGVMSGWTGNTTNVRVINCHIHHIGGSYLSGTIRYGNGIEIITGGSNWLVAGNEISHIYDTPFTCQGAGTWRNIRATQNLMHHTGIGLEMWATSGSMSNIVIDDNDLQDMGFGWGADVRADRDKRSAVITYPWGGSPMDITFTRNRVKRAVVYRWHETSYTGYVFSNNDIQLVSGTPMQYGQSYTINNAAAWRAANNNTDAGSVFTVL